MNKDLLRNMTSLDPNTRLSFDALLQSFRGTLFPESFYSFLHNYISSVNEVSSPSPFTRSHDETQRKADTLPNDSDRRLDRLWSEFDSVESYLFVMDDESDSGDTISEAPPVIQYGNQTLVGIAYQVRW